MNVNEENKNKKQLVIFDQIFLNSTKSRYVRRKVAEALRRMRDWLNRTCRQKDQVPMEFDNIEIDSANKREQEQKLWQIKFHT